jgi:peptidyl-prolyl cis-trans isomerase SurA
VWGRAAAAGQGFLIDRVVAVVNDEVITLSELQEEGKPLIQRIREELEGEAQTSQMEITQRQVLQAMIFRRLQLQEAKKEGIVVDEDDVTSSIELIKERNRYTNDAEFAEALAKSDLTLEEFRGKVYEQIMVERLLAKHVRTSVVVSEDEITEYYQAHLDDFDQSPSVRIRHILIRFSEDPSPEDVARARARAAEALAKLRNGAQFAEVAAQYSDGAAAQEGGDLGVIRQGEFDPTLERVAFSLEPGKVSDVIQTAAGLNIIRVEERTTGDVPIDKVRAQVRQRLYQEKLKQRMDAYFAELTQKAYIDVRLDTPDTLNP